MARNISLNFIPPSDIGPSQIIINPNNSYEISQSYAAYGCFFGVLLIVFIILIIKIAFNRKKIQARNAALRQTIIARQNQLSTVSHSIDVNSNYSNEGANNRRESEATLKIDLPPTYEEVMKNLADARERAAISATSTECVGNDGDETRNTPGNVGIQITTNPLSEQRSVVY